MTIASCHVNATLKCFNKIYEDNNENIEVIDKMSSSLLSPNDEEKLFQLPLDTIFSSNITIRPEIEAALKTMKFTPRATMTKYTKLGRTKN